jgi:hypothetical protein
MAEYWSLDEVRGRRDEIRGAVERLLSWRSLVLRPRSRQWLFFRQTIDMLFGDEVASCWLTRQQATQYKYEVENRLRDLYLKPGRPVPLLFRLMDRQQAMALGLIDEAYPSVLDYVMLIGPPRAEVVPPVCTDVLRDFLPSVIDRAAQAEFAVYKSVPVVDFTPLNGLFVINGPAYRRVQNTAEEHSKKNWTLMKPPYNPSTMRIIKVKLMELSEQRAYLRSHEYWYLRWWSQSSGKYVYVYQETNYQRYWLICQDGTWLVEANEYPQPRSTTPRRKPQQR